MQLGAGNLSVLISKLSLILSSHGTDSDQEDMFTYNTHDYADWPEYTIRLALTWHVNCPLGKEDTYLQEKKFACNQDAVGIKIPDLRTDTSVAFLIYETHSVYSKYSYRLLLYR